MNGIMIQVLLLHVTGMFVIPLGLSDPRSALISYLGGQSCSLGFLLL